MIPAGTKVVYDGGDPHTFGLNKGDMGFVSANDPLIDDGTTIVVEFPHPTQDRMYTQEVGIEHIKPVEDV